MEVNAITIKYMKQSALRGNTVKSIAKTYKVSEKDVRRHTEDERTKYKESRDSMIGIKYMNGDCRDCLEMEYNLSSDQIQNIGQAYANVFIEQLYEVCAIDHEQKMVENLYYKEDMSVKEIFELTGVEDVTEKLGIATINNKEYDRRLKIAYNRLIKEGKTHENAKELLEATDDDIERVLKSSVGK